jgi:hypothetical protein
MNYTAITGHKDGESIIINDGFTNWQLVAVDGSTAIFEAVEHRELGYEPRTRVIANALIRQIFGWEPVITTEYIAHQSRSVIRVDGKAICHIDEEETVVENDCFSLCYAKALPLPYSTRLNGYLVVGGERYNGADYPVEAIEYGYCPSVAI